MNLAGKRSLAPWANVITGEVARRMDVAEGAERAKVACFMKRL